MREMRVIVLAVCAAVLLQPVGARAWVLFAAFNPSPQAWTTTYESDPTNNDSIALSDDHHRQGKTETRDRAEVEHDWGSGLGNVTTDTGRHLEGSARCFVQTSAPSVTGSIAATCIAETDRNGNRGCDEGRCWVDTDGADGVLGGAGAADDYTYNIALDTDADGDADSWQVTKSDTAGGIGGTVPTNAMILWDTSSTCPAGYSEATEWRNLSIRGADIAVADANVPNSAGTSCTGSSAPAGCGAAGGTANYNDTSDASEIVSHTHTGPSHSHSVTTSNHTHTGPSHAHTIAHTHDTTIGNHGHTLQIDHSSTGGSSSTPAQSVDDGGAPDDTSPVLTDLTGGGTFVSSGTSTANSGSGGTGSTGSNGGESLTSGNGGTGATGSAGGTQPSLGPFRTALFCRKT